MLGPRLELERWTRNGTESESVRQTSEEGDRPCPEALTGVWVFYLAPLGSRCRKPADLANPNRAVRLEGSSFSFLSFAKSMATDPH